MQNKKLLRAVSIVLICLFLWNQVAWACPAEYSSLRPPATAKTGKNTVEVKSFSAGKAEDVKKPKDSDNWGAWKTIRYMAIVVVIITIFELCMGRIIFNIGHIIFNLYRPQSSLFEFISRFGIGNYIQEQITITTLSDLSEFILPMIGTFEMLLLFIISIIIDKYMNLFEKFTRLAKEKSVLRTRKKYSLIMSLLIAGSLSEIISAIHFGYLNPDYIKIFGTVNFSDLIIIFAYGGVVYELCKLAHSKPKKIVYIVAGCLAFHMVTWWKETIVGGFFFALAGTVLWWLLIDKLHLLSEPSPVSEADETAVVTVVPTIKPTVTGANLIREIIEKLGILPSPLPAGIGPGNITQLLPITLEIPIANLKDRQQKTSAAIDFQA